MYVPVLWNDPATGMPILGTYNGVTLQVSTDPGISFGASGQPDPIAGTSGSSELLAGSAVQAAHVTLTYCPWGNAGCVTTGYPTMCQLTSSWLHFDLWIVTPISEVDHFRISYGPYGCKAAFEIPLNTANLNTSFVHFDIYGGAFTMTGCNGGGPVAEIFQAELLRKVGGASAATFYINNVWWTKVL